MVLADGAVAAFDARFSNNVNDDDAVKMTNGNESLAIVQGSALLSIDARKAPVSNDTIFLAMGKLSKTHYVLQIFAQQMDTSLTLPYLQDAYLNTRLALSLADTNRVPFTVDGADPLSYAANRFCIVFIIKNKLPMPFIAVDSVETEVRVMPNPVTGGWMNVTINNMEEGTYIFDLLNANGQIVIRKTVLHSGRTIRQTIYLNPKIKAGLFYLCVQHKNDKLIKKVFIE